jgi:type II secretory pathway component PulF
VPDFEYIAIDAAGKRVRGSVAAASEAAALSELDARKLTPVSVAAGKGAARRRTRVSSRRQKYKVVNTAREKKIEY